MSSHKGILVNKTSKQADETFLLSTLIPEQLFFCWSQTRTEKEPAQALQSNPYKMKLLQRQARTGTTQNAKVFLVVVGGWMGGIASYSYKLQGLGEILKVDLELN